MNTIILTISTKTEIWVFIAVALFVVFLLFFAFLIAVSMFKRERRDKLISIEKLGTLMESNTKVRNDLLQSLKKEKGLEVDVKALSKLLSEKDKVIHDYSCAMEDMRQELLKHEKYRGSDGKITSLRKLGLRRLTHSEDILLSEPGFVSGIMAAKAGLTTVMGDIFGPTKVVKADAVITVDERNKIIEAESNKQNEKESDQ